MTGHEFELLMARLCNQDETLRSIDGKVDGLVLKVEDHDHHVKTVRRVAKWGSTIAATGLGAWIVKWLGWK